VIAVDTNILVYAHREDSPFHQQAFEVLNVVAEGVAAWAIPWACLHEFLAIATHPRIYAPPTPRSRALDQVDAWFESPSLRLLVEAEGYWSVLRKLVEQARIVGPQVHDARIAALCLHYGVTELWSADRDFSRFPGLRAVNPLVRFGAQ
jgi:toxin-antitoxin system PIN domain toxin